MRQPLLRLSQITKSFGAVRALKGVSFELHPGEVHALLGENGAGKSTLIKVITGAHQPDGGTLEIGGTTVSNLTPTRARKLGIACIYQQPALFPDLSVSENIGLRLEGGAFFAKVHWKQRRKNADALLARIGAALDPETPVRSLSMPEQQLVEIACALGSGAKTVIMDEPTASLTQVEQELLFGVVRDLRASGAGVVYISHRLEEIFALADRVTVLRDGQSISTRAVRSELGAMELTEEELISLMVGREVASIYPHRGGSPGETVLELENVCCAAGGIANISLAVRAGEILGLAGLVGAGRTELARVLFGITPADSGTIRLLGRNVQVRSPQQAVSLGIGYVPEDRRRHGVILPMPIAENMSMAVHPKLFPGKWLRFEAERALGLRFIEELGIKAYGPEAPGGSLSGGNQQKVSLARWLATEPRLLILDDPTQGVDVGAKSEIHRIIRDLAAKGLAVLMISSDLPEVLGMSDRIAVMRGGRLVETFEGSTATAQRVMSAALRPS
ncbi:MAG: rhamnose transport system ATP-binding protein [Verrucomicrobia bacterium]|nr:MAG: rhamnose transport system ATP-binding protein [Verrucomicrobiota bacterium]